jgi:ATP-dependent protease HslVU (ClpYQ) peptidase subunit
MTCIVALKKNGVVYMAGDSAGVSGLDIRQRSDPKVFKVQNFLIGYTSSFRMGQLLRYKLKVPKQKPSQSDFYYMCTTFIDSVRETLKQGGYSYVCSNKESIGTFLVGYKREIYTVCDDMQVAHHADDFDSVGCGDNYALGALAMLTTYTSLNPHTILDNALAVAAKFSGGVSAPFVILSSKELK